MKYIQRNGQIENVWKVTYKHKFFDWPVFIRGTEAEMQAYLESEIGYVGRYHAISEEQIKEVQKLKLKIYIAPQLQ